MKDLWFIIKKVFYLFLFLPVILYGLEKDRPSEPLADVSSFPEYVYYRTNRESYNNLYYFIMKQGKIYYTYNKHLTGRVSDWKALPVHKKMKAPRSLSADDENLVVIDETGQIFTMLRGLSEDPGDFKWTKRWGFPFWRGCGYKVTGEYLKWDISFISPFTDEYIQYPNGNKHDVGIGCTTVFLLNTDGRRITYIDPWLVNDVSNEITTPLRGEFKAVNMSASGSTLFVINGQGGMYTLLFDFDIAGMDDLFFHYSYHPEEWEYDKNPGKVVPRKVPRQLPIRGWVAQPGIGDRITDRITIIKKGKGALHRTLIVEGCQGDRTGYYTKDINDHLWSFVETGEPLEGAILDPGPVKIPDQGPADREPGMMIDRFRYKGEIIIHKKRYQVEIPDFNPYCFYSTLRFFFPGDEYVDFILHHNGKIRLTRREPGLSKKKLPMLGAIQGKDERIVFPDTFPVPGSIANHPDYLFLIDALGDFKEVKITVTTKGFRIKGKKIKGKLGAF